MSYARWATKEEIEKATNKINHDSTISKSGIPIMYDDNYLYINDNITHNLIIGGTGSGKTQATIMPQIYLSIKAGESFIVNDHAGELYETFSGMAKENDYKVQVINFRDMSVGNNYNPLYIPYSLYKKGNIDKSVELIENVGYNLISDFNQTNADPFWENMAINLFTGLTLYLFDKAKVDEININSVVNLINKVDEIKSEIKNDALSIVNTYLSPIFGAPHDTYGSIIAVFKQKLAFVISRDALSKLLSNNNIDLENVKNEKTALFIISDSKFSSIIMPMILNQVYNLVDISPRNERRLNIILDEFGMIKPIKDFLNILTGSRSMNIRLTLVVQSILHLENVYGKKNTDFIKMSIGNIVFLLSSDIETLEMISKDCGRKDENSLLINVEELKVLGYFEAIILMHRMYPIKTKLLPYYEFNIPKIEPIKQTPLQYNEVKLYK